MALTGDRVRIIAREHPDFGDGRTTGDIVAADGRGFYVASLNADDPLKGGLANLTEPEFIVLPKPREARP
jgi:hypothetical protein